ncbi:hypothetical protein SK128_006110 [Halocaridina rubra]|uniref:Uncharacterized protein n=1 Tax=Halocaridina rubra TaxID=373956 RepID=A0AAN8XF35_HALRR
MKITHLVYSLDQMVKENFGTQNIGWVGYREGFLVHYDASLLSLVKNWQPGLVRGAGALGVGVDPWGVDDRSCQELKGIFSV